VPEAPFLLRYTSDGVSIVRGRATITAEALILEPDDPPGPPVTVDFADIETASIGQVDVDLSTFDGVVYHLSHLAERFDPFAAAFGAARNERWVRGLLYRDQQLEREFRGEVEREAGGRFVRDKAVLRLYPSSLVALCATSDPFSISFHDMGEVTFDDAAYALRIGMPEGGAVSLYRLGGRFDEFERVLARLRQDLRTRVAAGLRALVPSLGEADALALARVAGHGRAFTRVEAEAAAAGSWEPLSSAVLGTPELQQTLEYLARRAPAGGVFLGLAVESEPEASPALVPDAPPVAAEATARKDRPDPKAAGEATATKPYVSWFLVTRPDAGKLAFEVTSEEGHATYVFRVDPARATEEARKIGRALVALNFAREPIYLPLDQLERGVRRRYQLAVRKLPYLNDLRERFVGRAIHNITWQQQVDTLLAP
jgi:hypothetical protein